VALRSHFAIVTGGPGTGKTTTVVRLLALLQHLALSAPDGSARRLRIRLAAPTGKAAARLNASISGAIDKLHLGRLEGGEAVRQAIPREVSTVHRLLGSFGGTRRFRHDATNPLPLDVLVLDEASMVDLETMAAVIAALPARARLVLLGDKDQLASVEAGNVLGELCSRADGGHYLPRTRDRLEALSGERIPADFVDARGEAAGPGRGEAAPQLPLRRGQRDRATGAGRERGRRVPGPRDPARGPWRPGLDGARSARCRLAPAGAGGPPSLSRRGGAPAIARCAAAGLRRLGALGAASLRRLPAPLRGAPRPPWRGRAQRTHRGPAACREAHAGRERLVRRPPGDGHRNDYALGLMNGDVGIALPLPVPEDPQRFLVRVAFEGSDGEIRWILPSRLPAVETVFAMTVHKSQGSEFGHAALLLPQEASRVLTRELVYTGITRARDRFTLAVPAGAGPVLDLALQRRTRQGGVAPQVAPAGGVRP
jgi:exodeoxyribonuclease V alpha subunit